MRKLVNEKKYNDVLAQADKLLAEYPASADLARLVEFSRGQQAEMERELVLGASVYAQMIRPTHAGTVWQLPFIHVKPGMDSAYDKYLASDWKKEQEALKAAGIVLSYKVIGTEAHSSNDWNLMLMVEYKDLASVEANEDKVDALLQKMFGGNEKVMQGYKERTDIREVMGTRLA